MPYIETRDGVSLFHQDWGAGEPVVFLSAWSLSSKMWQYQMITMVDRGMRCVAYDRRGHGRSDQPSDGYDYDTLADDLADVVDRIDLNAVTLVGHSISCGEIVRYLTRHGDDRVAKVVLVAPAIPFPLRSEGNPKGFDPGLIEATRAAWKQDLTEWIAAGLNGYIGAGLPGNDVSTGLIEWTKQDMYQTSLLALVECNRTQVETDFRPEMGKVDVPTLVIQGDHDVSAPLELTGKVCAELIDRSILKVYEYAPHGLYLTHRDRLSDDLVAFVKGSS